ncbi:MAG TPA: IS1595 family transposase [Allosphingosinicella sp.]|nr:IS1595 family transposase [Allosphingosinicella sp.]
MTKRKAPTLRQFQDRFPTEEACLDHLFRVRYGTDFECPGCARPAPFSRVRSRRSYQCQWCAYQVYPTAGTPFDRTRTPLRDWFYVMFLFTTTRNGVAAKRVERELGVTYKTAWRMCYEVRKYMAGLDSDDPLGGPGETVEIDETLIGGVGRHTGKRGRNLENKTFVLGMLEKGGEVVIRVIPDVKRATLYPVVCGNVVPGTLIHTDTLHSYRGLNLRGFRHQMVNHTAGEYVSDFGCTVNRIEGFWAMVKRTIAGTHIHVSPKHLPKYLGEIEYRWNMRQVPHLMLDRLMHSFVR